MSLFRSLRRLNWVLVWAGCGFGVAGAQAEKWLYVIDESDTSGDSRLIALRTDGSDQQVLYTNPQRMNSLAIDDSRRRVFWSEGLNRRLRRADLDNVAGTAFTIVSTHATLESLGELGFAPLTQRLFVETTRASDGFLSRIETLKPDGTDRQEILGPVSVAAFALDDVNREIYYEDRQSSSEATILRRDFDGSNRVTIAANVPTSTGFAADPANAYLYWTSSAGLSNGDGGVYRMKYDGSGFEELFVQGNNLDASNIALDAQTQTLYFVQESADGSEAIYRMATDGSLPQPVATGFDLVFALMLADTPPFNVGDVCGDAIEIDTLPFTDTDSTVGLSDTYNETCGVISGGAPDRVYRFTPTFDDTISISLCAATDFDARVYVFEGFCRGKDSGAAIACSEDVCTTAALGTPLAPRIDALWVEAGTPYFIVVDGKTAGDAGLFTVDVQPVCTLEPEPCGERLNQGCTYPAGDPKHGFTPLHCGETICGTTEDPAGPTLPSDPDFYEFTLDEPSDITLTAIGEFTIELSLRGFIELGNTDCALVSDRLYRTTAGAGNPAILQRCLPAGSYVVEIRPNPSDPDCPAAYRLSLNCVPAVCPTGACCILGEGCVDGVTLEACEWAAGDWYGVGSTCGGSGALSPVPPPNDDREDCLDASGPGLVVDLVDTSTAGEGPPSIYFGPKLRRTAHDVWYCVTPPTDCVLAVAVDPVNRDYEAVAAIHLDVGGEPVQQAFDFGALPFEFGINALAGETYYVQVGATGLPPSGGLTEVHIECRPAEPATCCFGGACVLLDPLVCAGSNGLPLDAPCGDSPCLDPPPETCAGALEMSGCDWQVGLNLSGLGDDGPAAPCDDEPTNPTMLNDTWFRWTPPVDTFALLTVEPLEYVTDVVAVRYADCNGPPLECVDSGGVGVAETLAFEASAGVPVYLQVGEGGDITSGGGRVRVTLSCPLGCAPLPSACAAGTLLAAPTNHPIGVGTRDSVLVDLDNDGLLDRATIRQDLNAVNVAFGDGSGGFEDELNVAVPGGFINNIAAGDFVPDGFADLAVVNNNTATVGLIENEGNRFLFWSLNLATPTFPHAVAIADLDQDHATDIAVSNAGTVRVYWNNGTGGLGDSFTDYSLSGPALTLLATDLNDDDLNDLLMTNSAGDDLAYRLNTGARTFGSIRTVTVSELPQGVAPADFNCDGHVDLAVSCSSQASQVWLLLGNGRGEFVPTFNIGLAGAIRRLATGDLNDDGAADIIVATEGFDRVTVLTGDGAGGVLDFGVFLVDDQPADVEVGDLDGDGVDDVLATNIGGGNVSVLRSTCVPRFGDVNGDRYLDGQDGLTLSDCLSGPNVTIPPAGCAPADFAAADLSGDGDVDLQDAGISAVLAE